MTALVSTYTGNNYVPPAIAKEAVVLVVAYAFDRQVVPGASWAATLRNSGAESLLRPFVGTRGAIVGGQAGQSNGVSTAGPGVDEQGAARYCRSAGSVSGDTRGPRAVR